MMTKATYQIIADVFTLQPESELKSRMLTKFSEAAMRDNPRFDPEKFAAACKYKHL